MEKDPSVVARLAVERRDENWKFRTYTKMLSARRAAKMDALAERLGNEAAAQMDCRTCGACCKSCHVPVTDEEVSRLASLASLPMVQFQEQCMDPDDDGDLSLKAPCRFLEGTVCSIYEHRPEACRAYPYIGGEISTRIIAIIERAEVCPIIFEMLEGLKREMGFRRYR